MIFGGTNKSDFAIINLNGFAKQGDIGFKLEPQYLPSVAMVESREVYTIDFLTHCVFHFNGRGWSKQ